jgi:hypothetical protein
MFVREGFLSCQSMFRVVAGKRAWQEFWILVRLGDRLAASSFNAHRNTFPSLNNYSNNPLPIGHVSRMSISSTRICRWLLRWVYTRSPLF